MKFDTPATVNPIDQLKIIGQPMNRIDGLLKTTGTARYAEERHDVVQHPAYGYVVGSAIAKGRIRSIGLAQASRAPGVAAALSLRAPSSIRLAWSDVARGKSLSVSSPALICATTAAGVVTSATGSWEAAPASPRSLTLRPARPGR